MVATLQTRKEALEAKITEKTAELKRLCLKEADLTGVLPPEIPLDPGEPPPVIRRRVGTSFSFPQSLINNLNGSDDASLGALELECKVQTNIAEAALALANDLNASKSVRRKHRLMYRQSQRHLMELETRLSLLKQGKHQPMKPQQIKKKPRPNTTTIDHNMLMREYNNQHVNGYISGIGSWPVKTGPDYFGDDDLRHFSSSLNRPPRSSGTSISSNSPRLSARDIIAFNSSGLPDQHTITSSLSQPNMQDLKPFVTQDVPRELRLSERRSGGRRQWDSQSAGGTLLPNQTYPESHQPNLNRTQSLGSVDGQWQNQEKEKEWYETSLDSAPSPPLRTSSRLPTSARMLYHMQESQIRDAVNRSLATQKVHPSLTRTHRATPVDEITSSLQGTRIASPTTRKPQLASESFQHAHVLRGSDMHAPYDDRPDYHRIENNQQGLKSLRQHEIQPTAGLHNNHEALIRQVSGPKTVEYPRRVVTPQTTDNFRIPQSNHTSEYSKNVELAPSADAVYIDIPEDEVDAAQNGRVVDGVKTPTQPYYHTGAGWVPSIPGLPQVHPPHAVIQEEITFDTLVPFESPLNHTVVQAGIWQPYREVTKPFEMSDFYKYSTKFRQARQSPGQQNLPEHSKKLPAQAVLHQRISEPSITSEPLSPNTLMAVYQPLRPMTCQPVERSVDSSNSTSTAHSSTPKIV